MLAIIVLQHLYHIFQLKWIPLSSLNPYPCRCITKHLQIPIFFFGRPSSYISVCTAYTSIPSFVFPVQIYPTFETQIKCHFLMKYFLNFSSCELLLPWIPIVFVFPTVETFLFITCKMNFHPEDQKDVLLENLNQPYRRCVSINAAFGIRLVLTRGLSFSYKQTHLIRFSLWVVSGVFVLSKFVWV